MSMGVRNVVELLLDRFPAAWAEPWDRIGLLAGDGDREVGAIGVALDADAASITRAVDGDIDLLLTHHPPFLEGPADYVRPSGTLRALWDGVTHGLSVASFHTNLDRSPEGATALPRVLGLPDGVPLEEDVAESDAVWTFVPADAAEAVRGAMASAGAGEIGEYRGCSFETRGIGRFTPGDRARPAVGDPQRPQEVDEVRIEATCAKDRTSSVIRAIAEVHPYEEPVVNVAEVRVARGVARLGRLCVLDSPMAVDELASRVATSLEVAPRVWGASGKEIRTVACANGSATSLVARAAAAGADALVCGEVRYHASHDAASSGLMIVEAGHDRTETPLVSVLAGAAREVTEGAGIAIEEIVPEPMWQTWGG